MEEFYKWAEDGCPYYEGWEKYCREMEAVWEHLG